MESWSITDDCYAKVTLLKAHILAYKIDIICLSETYLDSTIQSDNDNLEIPVYNLVHSDRPSNNAGGIVCIYYKASLPRGVIGIYFLQECITFEVMIGDKQFNFVALYRSPSQKQDEFDSFSKKSRNPSTSLRSVTLVYLESFEILTQNQKIGINQIELPIRTI